MISKKSKIFVAGHNGLVGSAIVRRLKDQGYKNIILRNKSSLDLTNQLKVNKFLKKYKPKFIFIAAAKVGGIYSNNKFKADFIFNNLSIQTNLIHSAFLNGIKNLIFLGSSCVYPRNCPQPIKENYLLGGKLEKTNDAYAIAKIAGIKMCESYNEQYNMNYKCIMPTNTFGPNDKYDSLNSHFLPALIKKIDNLKKNKKKKLVLWGNGMAKREVIYADDIADACIYFMNKKIKENMVNVGTGKDLTIKKYAELMLRLIIPERKIKIVYDRSKPNGTPRKILNSKLAKNYGWKAKVSLNNGFEKVIRTS